MIISHPAHKEHQRKPLTQHLEAVAEAAHARIQRLSLATLLITKEDLALLAYRCGLIHDIGKASSYFQNHIRGERSTVFSRHSLISALYLYCDLALNPKLQGFALLAFKAVQRHHGNLSAFGSENLRDGVLIQNTLKIHKDLQRQIIADDDLRAFFERHRVAVPSISKDLFINLSFELEELDIIDDEDDAIERFLIQNLLYSVLIDADKHDAARLENIPDQSLLCPISYSPRKLLASRDHNENDLNKIRGKLLDQASSTDTSPTNCYAMSAPTGSGKTLACMGFCDALQSSSPTLRRVIYCLPYTSIIDQNHQEISKLLGLNGVNAHNPDLLLKHHHLVDFSRENQDEDYDFHDYLSENLIADSWSAACVVSTFVQLFHSLIGSQNSLVRKLHNIINSIILLDEVQSLPPKYYPLLRRIFNVLAQRFDTPILSCTATQPFIFEPDSFLEICPPGLFDHPIFNRVKLEISSQGCTLDEFADQLELDNVHNALFVMNTKRSAIDLFRILKDQYGDSYRFFCLTTFQTPKSRLCRIAEIKTALENKERIILVSTQLIEAGVDLSFQRVYRDFGPLDSVIQVAGRCNRHSEYGVLGGRMSLLLLTDDGKEYCRRVYDNYLLQKTKEALRGKHSLESRDFPALIRYYYHSLEFSAESTALMNAIKELNYDADYKDQLAVNKFRLIEEKYATNSLLILENQCAQDALDAFIKAKEKLALGSFMTSKEESFARLTVKKSYHVLSAYQLNLSPHELRNYSIKMSYFHKVPHLDNVYYVPFSDFDKAYDSETGFILEPTTQGSAMSL